MDSSPPGSSVHGALRQECCGGLQCPPSGTFHDPGIEPASCGLDACWLPVPKAGRVGTPLRGRCGAARGSRELDPQAPLPQNGRHWSGGPGGLSLTRARVGVVLLGGHRQTTGPAGSPAARPRRGQVASPPPSLPPWPGPLCGVPGGWQLSRNLQGRAVRSDERVRPVSGKMEEAGAWSKRPLAPQPGGALPAPAACDRPSAPGRQPQERQSRRSGRRSPEPLSPPPAVCPPQGSGSTRSLLPPLWGSGSWDRAGRGL